MNKTLRKMTQPVEKVGWIEVVKTVKNFDTLTDE